MRLVITSFLEGLFFTLLLTGLLFNIKFKGLGPTFFISSAVLAVMAFYYLYRNNFKYSKRLLLPVLFLSLFIISVLTTAILNSRIDIFLVSLIAGIFFVISVAPYALLSHFKGREIEVIRYVCYAGIVNVFFILGMFLFSGFREFYLSLLSRVGLLHVYGESALHSLYALRLVGLTGSATYGMAVIQVVMSFLYVFYIKETKGGFSYFNLIVLILLMLSAVVAGRTAFVGFVFLYMYMLFVFNKKELFSFALMSSLLVIVFFLLASFYLPSDFYDFFERWVLQLFLVGEKIGSLEINKSLLDNYSFSDFSLFGDFKWHGNELRNTYYMDTDIGWYRFTFAFGFVGVFFLVIYLLSYLKLSFRFRKNHLVSVFIVLFLLVVMFKGAILFDFYMVFFVLTVLFYLNRTEYYK